MGSMAAAKPSCSPTVTATRSSWPPRGRFHLSHFLRGAYAYPLTEAVAVSSAAVARFLVKDRSIGQVRLVFFSHRDAELFLEHHSFADI
jgi:hypothetical protein